MTGPSSVPGDPLPRVPSQDGARLAMVIGAVEWELRSLVHGLPTGRCHVDRVHGMAVTLRHLADHLDAVAGIVPGEIESGDGPGDGLGP